MFYDESYSHYSCPSFQYCHALPPRYCSSTWKSMEAGFPPPFTRDPPERRPKPPRRPSRELPWLIIMIQFIIIVALIVSISMYMVSRPVETSNFSTTVTFDSVQIRNLPTPPNFRKIVKVPPATRPVEIDEEEEEENESSLESGGFKAAVFSESAICSEIGRSILVRGGNAVDAAIGTMVCMTAVHPHKASLGGGMIMLVNDKQKFSVITARETAPAAASQAYFSRKRVDAEQGAKASCVPGNLNGLFRAYEKYSSKRISWKQLFVLTIHLCTRGFEVDEALDDALQTYPHSMINDEQFRRTFFNSKTNKTFTKGDILTCPELAATLSDLSEYEDPVDYFYRGDISERLVQELQSRDYESDISEAICSSIDRKSSICGPGPPSIFMLLANSIAAARNSTEEEALDIDNIAWENIRMIADPVFFPLARSFTRSLTEQQSIEQTKLIGVSEKKEKAEQLEKKRNEEGSTTVLVVDENGMNVVLTFSLGDQFGNKLYSQLGFFMNNQMRSFSSFENTPNSLQPGKVPATSMSPIIFLKNKKVEALFARYFNQFRFLYKRNMDATSSILVPPEDVRGMTKLVKEKFNVSVKFPVLEVDSKDIDVISRRVRLEEFLIGQRLKPLKNFVDGTTQNRKYIVFNPDKVDKDDEVLKTKISHLIIDQIGEEKIEKLRWNELEKLIGFDNWDLKTLIKSVLPDNLEYSSFTQSGHIIHCNFSDQLLPFRFIIAEILLNKVNNCRTVVQKSSIITNVYRNLELELLAGEEDYVTELREEGLRYKLDFSKVYWNSRLSHEHARVIKKFDKNSLVYDACCGIGPFVLPAWLKRKPRRIVANDLNPESVRWLKENVKINKVPSTALEVHKEDASKFISGVVADDFLKEISKNETETSFPSGVHVIMNLPAFAINFLPAFRGILRDRLDRVPEERRCSWTVYCYLFAKSHIDVEEDWYEKEARRMVEEKLDWPDPLISHMHNVRTVSSRKEMFCAEVSISYAYLTAEPKPLEPSESEEPSAKKAKN
ncbi:unnamed protein product [Caenorhabditis auriculariae]|uniref:tRNA (guanine(37)-N1)-methyltransferase n=1 Tax=Caenorhabditis auriculariae TaxID=2777116 RepID=A0A8S1HQH6_9PELO|nr:unnamed protein product [Caenorhabditis auriculariae]